jgi:hypothetical protein
MHEGRDYVFTYFPFTVFVSKRRPPGTNITNENFDYDTPHVTFIIQMFDYNLDLKISYKRDGQRYGLCADSLDGLYFEDCEIERTTWIYDNYRRYIIHTESIKCLTAAYRNSLHLRPRELEPQSVAKVWKFQFEKKDETFKRMYQNMTVEDLEFVQEELQSRPAESVTEVEDLFNLGSFIQNKKGKKIKRI